MFSYLRGFFGPLAHPTGFLWLLLLAAALVLLKKRQRLGALFMVGFALLLSVFGGRNAVYLVGWLEEPYILRSYDDVPTADAVVLLGGSHEVTKNDLIGFNLNEAADRIFVALEMMRLKKSDTLVVGGGGGKIDGREITEGEALLKWCASWGMTNFTALPLAKSRNTREEALKTAALAREKGWKKIILVTTGVHMKRAAATFRTVGLEVIPVGCDFQRTGTPYTAPINPFPIRNGTTYLNYWLHETIGWWVYRWRGWINAEAAQITP